MIFELRINSSYEPLEMSSSINSQFSGIVFNSFCSLKLNEYTLLDKFVERANAEQPFKVPISMKDSPLNWFEM